LKRKISKTKIRKKDKQILHKEARESRMKEDQAPEAGLARAS
jgi:hypothetical protein